MTMKFIIRDTQLYGGNAWFQNRNDKHWEKYRRVSQILDIDKKYIKKIVKMKRMEHDCDSDYNWFHYPISFKPSKKLWLVVVKGPEEELINYKTKRMKITDFSQRLTPYISEGIARIL